MKPSRARIVADRLSTPEELSRLEEEVKAEIDEAVRFAERSSEPGAAAIYDEVYSSAFPVVPLAFPGERGA